MRSCRTSRAACRWRSMVARRSWQWRCRPTRPSLGSAPRWAASARRTSASAASRRRSSPSSASTSSPTSSTTRRRVWRTPALAETLAVVRGGGRGGAAATARRRGRRAWALRPRLRHRADTTHAAPARLPRLRQSAHCRPHSRRGSAGRSATRPLLGGADLAAKLDARWSSWSAGAPRHRAPALLTDPDVTDFVVVGIPSRLSVAEQRLLGSRSRASR